MSFWKLLEATLFDWGNRTFIFKKDGPFDNLNYRPVSILPLLLKDYERTIYDQLSQHSVKFLKSISCGFCKAHSTQHALSNFSTLGKEN